MPVSINGTTGLITAGASSSGGGGVATNTALGGDALVANTSGARHTAVGYQAGYSVSTNDAVTAVGYFAGYSNTGGFATFVGRNAGYLSTASKGTMIGDGAGSEITTGANNTIIGRYNGNQGGLDIRTASNHIVLSDGDGNPRAYWNASGEFGLVRSGGNTLQNILVGYAGGDAGAFNNFCAIAKQTTASVSTSATVIYSGPNRSCVVCVQGWQSANYFSDILNCSSNSVSVISSQNSTGSPSGRTYSISSFQLTLAMASGTYEIAMVALGTSRKD